ncbi:zinc-ribbon domain-containing protein [Heyndrickxia oleronia]|uniref:zinc-ribbon domain-containing protein n=1 Tax=Heyndrickxia oleronia TaxID=38875 RepID=UPI003F21896B
MSIKMGTSICVKIEDVSSGSNVKVTKICDDCGKKVHDSVYSDVINRRNKGDGRDRCSECGQKIAKKNRRNNLKYEKSLEYYAKQNNKEYLLLEFCKDNIRPPNKVSYGSSDKYKWKCTECNSTYYTIVHSKTIGNSNCPYCSGRRVNVTNCLWRTHPEIADLLVDYERGFLVSKGNSKKELFECPDCKEKQYKSTYLVTKNGFSCNNCSDGISYPEKFMGALLNQLKIKFIRDSSFEWSKDIIHSNKKLCGNKRYDFYIPELNCIIETHGRQHYDGGFETVSDRTLQDEQQNDILKEKIAYENGIKNYIIVNCKFSELEYIKTSILSSELKYLLNLELVDWKECHKSACKSLVKIVSNLWNDKELSLAQIAERLKVSKNTAYTYLKQAKEIGWCKDEEPRILFRNKIVSFRRHGRTKKVIQLSESGEFIKEWNSATEASKSLDITTNIQRSCKGQRKTVGGYRWMYKEDYEKKKKLIKPIKAGSTKEVVQLYMNCYVIANFSSISEANRKTGISIASISGACRGIQKTAGGYKWMYKEDYENNILPELTKVN